MNNTSHTPGPWKVFNPDTLLQGPRNPNSEPSNYLVIRLTKDGFDTIATITDKDDAALIAVAPVLKDIAKYFLDAVPVQIDIEAAPGEMIDMAVTVQSIRSLKAVLNEFYKGGEIGRRV